MEWRYNYIPGLAERIPLPPRWYHSVAALHTLPDMRHALPPTMSLAVAQYLELESPRPLLGRHLGSTFLHIIMLAACLLSQPCWEPNSLCLAISCWHPWPGMQQGLVQNLPRWSSGSPLEGNYCQLTTSICTFWYHSLVDSIPCGHCWTMCTIHRKRTPRYCNANDRLQVWSISNVVFMVDGVMANSHQAVNYKYNEAIDILTVHLVSCCIITSWSHSWFHTCKSLIPSFSLSFIYDGIVLLPHVDQNVCILPLNSHQRFYSQHCTIHPLCNGRKCCALQLYFVRYHGYIHAPPVSEWNITRTQCPCTGNSSFFAGGCNCRNESGGIHHDTSIPEPGWVYSLIVWVSIPDIASSFLQHWLS